MNIQKGKMRPNRIATFRKRDLRTQFGALCYRVVDDRLQVLLITSRGTGRWILPKGWPIPGITPARVAMQEAWEEAGVKGRTQGQCVGFYSYIKRGHGGRLPCVVAVFAVKVQSLRQDFPEAGQRNRKWFSRKKAAKLLEEPELRRLVREFDPHIIRR